MAAKVTTEHVQEITAYPDLGVTVHVGDNMYTLMPYVERRSYTTVKVGLSGDAKYAAGYDAIFGKKPSAN